MSINNYCTAQLKASLCTMVHMYIILIIQSTTTTTSHCCHAHSTVPIAQCSILLFVTTLFCLLPRPVVTFSIYSSPKCVCGVVTCVFIPGQVWACPYLAWVWWHIDWVQLNWGALRCSQSKQWGTYLGSSAFHRSHLIGYYQEADCPDDE